jgi:heme exporter protein A
MTTGLVLVSVALERRRRVLFHDLGTQLVPGGALMLTGRNGTGKTSLLRLVAGLLSPTAGQILIDGAVSTDADRRRWCGLLPHQDALKPHQTVGDTLTLWAGLTEGVAALTAPAFLEAQDMLDLAALWPVPCRYLSAGQRRRVALARLVLASRPIWLLDEPMVALDAGARTGLMQLVGAHRHAGGMIVASSHELLPFPGAAQIKLGQSTAEFAT